VTEFLSHLAVKGRVSSSRGFGLAGDHRRGPAFGHREEGHEPHFSPFFRDAPLGRRL
jgi:hypothetical protein